MHLTVAKIRKCMEWLLGFITSRYLPFGAKIWLYSACGIVLCYMEVKLCQIKKIKRSDKKEIVFLL